MKIRKIILMTFLGAAVTTITACSGRKTNNKDQDSGATTVGTTDSLTDSSNSTGQGVGSHQDSSAPDTSKKDTTRKP